MSKSGRTILQVLFPDVRARILQLLFDTPLQQCYVRELARKTGLTLHTVQDELRKLAAVGLLNSWSNGYHRFYRANRDHAFFAPLTKIVRTNAKLPKTKHAALRRRFRARAGRTSKRPAYPLRLPADYPTRWGLFSKRSEI
jgi:predicted transcriptional regulator